MADTHPGDGNAERLHDYWVHGEGAAQIRWGTEGAHTRCHRLLMQHAHMTSEQAWGYCQLAGHAATGKYSGEDKSKGHHGRTGRVTTYTRSFPLEDISIRAGGDGRTVDAYATIFDVSARIHDEDGRYEEINDRTMYNKALSDAAPAGGRQSWRVGVFYNHGMTIWKTPSDLYSMPVGVPLDIHPDGRGLFTRTRYLPGQLGDQILEGIKEGTLTTYSVSGQYLRSDPPVPRGGFRPDHAGKLPVVRRMESTLREYGPTPFPAYAGAEVIGVRAEQIATMLSMLDPDERERLVTLLRSGTPLEPPEPGTSEVEAAAEEPPPMRHSTRPPHLELQAQRAKFLIKHGGGRIGA
jgi:phage head maturation protease